MAKSYLKLEIKYLNEVVFYTSRDLYN